MTTIVSVVIPCYNHAHYVRYALDSVLAQTFADWEAIVVDDGSTDDTPSAVAAFVDPRVRYIRQTNQGLSAARNTGVEAAQGEYLAFLDADDAWRPGFLQRCVSALSRDPALSGVYTRVVFIDPEHNTLPQLGGETVPAAAFRDRLKEGGFFPPCAVLVRATMAREAGSFDTHLTSLEDWDMWLRISERRPMLGLLEPLACYRVYPGSMSTNVERMHKNRIAVLVKHFGELGNDGEHEADEKRRAYGFVCRCTALDHIQQGHWDEGWDFLEQGIGIWPGLLARLDTFYELACGSQPRGYRGGMEKLDIDGNGSKILGWLNGLLSSETAPFAALKPVASGNAYLALGMLSDQAGRCVAARRYLWRAIGANPRLITVSVIRRLLKLSLGCWLLRRRRQN